MTSTVAGASSKPALHFSFFFWMTVVMSCFVFAGFGFTYWKPMASGSLSPLPPIVHIHGFLFSFWMILLMTQSLLVNIRKVSLHRSLGMFGIAVATAVLITGALITLLFARSSTDVTGDYYNLMYLSIVAVLSFGTLFFIAIQQVKKPENHKRLILFALIPLLPPGINRLYMVNMGLAEVPLIATYLTMDAMAAAILIYDWKTLGRISRISLLGITFVLLQQLLHAPIVGSESFASFCSFLTDLIYYR